MPFDPIARFYDQDDGQIQEDIPMLLAFARKTGGPILDLGAGTGRLSLPLAEAGYDVTAIDSAANMLAIARQKVEETGVGERIKIVEGDFTRFELADRFGLAWCGFNGFLHLLEIEDQLAALRCWRGHLRDDGLLVIDVHNPQLEHLASADGSLVLAGRWIDPASGNVIHKLYASYVELGDQIYTIQRFYDETGDDGSVRRTSITFPTRILFRKELELLLIHAGYRSLTFYGDYELSPWESDSPRIIAIARPG